MDTNKDYKLYHREEFLLNWKLTLKYTDLPFLTVGEGDDDMTGCGERGGILSVAAWWCVRLIGCRGGRDTKVIIVAGLTGRPSKRQHHQPWHHVALSNHYLTRQYTNNPLSLPLITPLYSYTGKEKMGTSENYTFCSTLVFRIVLKKKSLILLHVIQIQGHLNWNGYNLGHWFMFYGRVFHSQILTKLNNRRVKRKRASSISLLSFPFQQQ